MQIVRWKQPGTVFCVAGLGICLASSLISQTMVDPVQQRRAAHLYSEFIAPCCWRQSVAVHQSEASMKVRSEIDTKILLGDSDTQIKAALVKEYGHGILMEPEGIRAFLAYSIPILGFTLGVLAVVNWMRSHRGRNEESTAATAANAAMLPDLDFDQ